MRAYIFSRSRTLVSTYCHASESHSATPTLLPNFKFGKPYMKVDTADRWEAMLASLNGSGAAVAVFDRCCIKRQREMVSLVKLKQAK